LCNKNAFIFSLRALRRDIATQNPDVKLFTYRFKIRRRYYCHRRRQSECNGRFGAKVRSV